MIKLTNVHLGVYGIQYWWQTTTESKDLITTLVETYTHAALCSILTSITNQSTVQNNHKITFTLYYKYDTSIYSDKEGMM